ncbi:MAG: hypothetical protein SFV54_06220 [Bryobacteraceae bacterium]|nr:hypothetical protein [Bryobacteraceae bacterium]
MSDRPRGKWGDPAVPHKGWTRVDFEDLEALSGVRRICQSQEIRYVHYLQHPKHTQVIVKARLAFMVAVLVCAGGVLP